MTVYRENGADGDVEVINESDSTHFNNLNNIYFSRLPTEQLTSQLTMEKILSVAREN